MGILDEAIREHLELKRQHGAEEKEIEGLEAEAFGPADRPDATEAETQIISPGSSVTAPAGEGDQLDKVFEATREAEAAAQEQAPSAETGAPAPPAEAPSAEAAASPSADEPTFAEHRLSDAPESPAESKAETDTAAEASVVEEAPEPAAEVAPEPPSGEQPLPEQEGDAGDMLEAERHHLASHPTEHYDVDAAIAEEDEIDLLSESSLSDELDRALDGPSEPAAAESELAESALAAEEPITADPIEEPRSDRSEFEAPAEPQLPAEDEELDEDEAEDSDEGSGADFFDQEDPLEGTPDFLEETPEHDRLWFEQKEPKDFDFGD